MTAPLRSDSSDSQRILVGFVLNTRVRFFCVVVGLAVMGLSAYTTIDDGPSTTAAVALVAGAVFVGLAVIGQFGRLVIEPGATGPRLSLEPPYPTPEEPSHQEATGRPRPVAPQPSEIEKPVSPEDETGAREADANHKDPFRDAIGAHFEKNHAKFDSKMREAIAAEEDEGKKVALDAMRLAWLYEVGQAERLGELRALREQHPESPFPFLRIGECYDTVGEHQKAVQTYEEGLASSALSVDAKLKVVVALSGTLRKTKRFDEGESRLLKALGGAQSEDARANLHKSLAELYEDWGKNDLKHWHLEKSLEENPSEIQTRFSLAHSYTNVGYPLAALYHYRIVVAQRGDAWEYNNLGVIMDGLEMPITAAKYYRRAIDQKNTLAAANLAQTALASGLVDVADRLVAEAQKQEEVHANVHRAATSIAQSKLNEEERLGRIQEGSALEREMFLRRMQLNCESPPPITPQEIEGVWDTSVGKMTLIKKDDGLAASFTEDGLWSWQLSGTIAGRVYTFKWEHSRKSQNDRGDGYFLFTAEKEFEGIIRHSPSKGEVRSVKGKWEQRFASHEQIEKYVAQVVQRFGDAK